MTTKLTGHEAITYAELHGGLLCKYEDPTEDDRDDLTPDQAREVAREDPSLIYTFAPDTEPDVDLTVIIRGLDTALDTIDGEVFNAGTKIGTATLIGCDRPTTVGMPSPDAWASTELLTWGEGHAIEVRDLASMVTDAFRDARLHQGGAAVYD